MFSQANNAFDISTKPQSIALQFDIDTPSWYKGPLLQSEKNFLAAGMQGPPTSKYMYPWQRNAGMRGLGGGLGCACEGYQSNGLHGYFANENYLKLGTMLKSGMSLAGLPLGDASSDTSLPPAPGVMSDIGTSLCNVIGDITASPILMVLSGVAIYTVLKHR